MLNRYKDVFSSFERHEVRYLVIGGIAAVLHGVPRATFDLDILVDAEPENVRRLLTALTDAGLGTASLTTRDEVLSHEITVFEDRIRIDVQTRTPGLAFANGWHRRVTMEFDGQPFQVVCRADLIASKRAAGRDVDREDVRLLEAAGAQDPSRSPDQR